MLRNHKSQNLDLAESSSQLSICVISQIKISDKQNKIDEYLYKPYLSHSLAIILNQLNQGYSLSDIRIKVIDLQIHTISLRGRNLKFIYFYQIFNMGGQCSTPSPSMDLPSQSSSEDPTLVLPDFQAMKTLINKKSGEMDINLTETVRKSSNDSQLSLILPACKNCSHNLIIRYYLLYNFHISKYTQKSSDKRKFQDLFLRLLTQSCTQNEQKVLISQLKTQYEKTKTNETKLSLLLLNYAFKSNFILYNLNKVLLFSNDPKALAYFIFPIHAMHSAIVTNFKKPDIARKDPIYIVAVLQDKEVAILKKMEGTQNYFFFSVFMKGYTDLKCANEAAKTSRETNKQNTFVFTVNFPYDYTKLSTEENKGFYIYKEATPQIKKKGDVIFNIMSSFKMSSKTSKFQYDLEYGELAKLYYQKVQQRLPAKQPILIKIYQLCRGVSKVYLKSQSCLFRIIGGKDEALNVSNLVLKSSNQSLNQTVINDIQRQNIINTHIQKGDLDLALKNVGENQSLLFKAKRIQILYEKAQFQQVKNEIAKIKESQLKDNKNLESRLIIDLITARIEMNSNQFKKAHQRLKNLYSTVEKIYPDDFEYIGRDVVSALVECDRRGSLESELQKTIFDGAGSYNGLSNALSLSSISVKGK